MAKLFHDRTTEGLDDDPDLKLLYEVQCPRSGSEARLDSRLDAYRVYACEDALNRCIVYGYSAKDDLWIANPYSERWLILQLVKEMKELEETVQEYAHDGRMSSYPD